jgi:hypothetical protein
MDKENLDNVELDGFGNENIFIKRANLIREEIVKQQKELTQELQEFDNLLIEAKEAEDLTMRDELPELIVKSGQQRSITQRIHNFKRVRIEKGGTLKIVGVSRQWCIIDCKEDFICQGTIIGIGVPYGSSPVNAITPNRTQLSYSYPTLALGGRGGSGGNSVANTRHDSARRGTGGSGATGTLDYGGGGGGGAGALFCKMCRQSKVQNGENASSYRGGFGGQVDNKEGAKGGDGVRAKRNRNGALLYIKAKSFDGTEGYINLSGLNGSNGSNGEKAYRDNYSGSAAGNGGGGGGAPGGDGGVMIVEFNSLTAEARVNIQSGSGGSEGQSGNGPGNNGRAGYRGDDGEVGYVDWVQL